MKILTILQLVLCLLLIAPLSAQYQKTTRYSKDVLQSEKPNQRDSQSSLSYKSTDFKRKINWSDILDSQYFSETSQRSTGISSSGGQVSQINREHSLLNRSHQCTHSHYTTGDIIDSWQHSYGYAYSASSGQAIAVVVDPFGNIYITGCVAESDYLTLKYDPSGTILWSAQFSSSGNFVDIAYGLAVDNVGNCYVTGKSGSGTSSDYLTIKYNTNGEQQWIAKFNGSGNSQDCPTAIVVDESGYIYITGASDGLETESDYATVKYDPNGNMEWVTRYNGSGNGSDCPTALAVDNMGNIYVTGISNGDSTTRADYATIKYDVNGTMQWITRYDGQLSRDDCAKGIAIDDSGFVYVTGWSWGKGQYDGITTDCATIKYNAVGTEVWCTRYEGFTNYKWTPERYDVDDMANAIAVDDSGNVFITGRTEGCEAFNDFLIVKYDRNGIEKWCRYSNDGEYYDLVLSPKGNIVSSGTTFARYMGLFGILITNHNAAGERVWSQSLDEFYWMEYSYYERDIAIDLSGNIYIAGTGLGENSTRTGYDFILAKYDSSGKKIWLDKYEHMQYSCNKAVAIAVDEEGDTFVTGTSHGLKGTFDYETIKYSTYGELRENIRYEGGSLGDISPKEIVVAATGHIFVTGQSIAQEEDNNFTTIKYGSCGSIIWIRHFNGPEEGDDTAVDLTADRYGNAYITGSSVSNQTAEDYVTIKYASDGTQCWIARYDGPAHQKDVPQSIALDLWGNVYVTGSSVGVGTAEDYVTIKYDQSGIQKWVARYNSPANNHDYAIDIGIDYAGNAFVTGASHNFDYDFDYLTIKYNSDGIQQWISCYNGPTTGNENQTPVALALDGSGNVFVTGLSETQSDATTKFYATVKYNTSGVEEWTAIYDESESYATNIAVDQYGSVYVTGYSRQLDSLYHYVTIKYDGLGNEQWLVKSDGPENYHSMAQDIAIDCSGNVYVTGTSQMRDNIWSMYTTAKYIQSPGPINYRPRLTSTPDTVANVGIPFTYLLKAEDLNVDFNNDSLSFSLLVAPQWLAIDSTRNLVHGIPTVFDGESMDTVFVVQVKDSKGSTDRQGFHLKILNFDHPPRISWLPDSLVLESGVWNELDIWEMVYDDFTPDSLLSFRFVLSTDSVLLQYDPDCGILRLKPFAGFSGDVVLCINVMDLARNDAKFELLFQVPKPSDVLSGDFTIPAKYELLQNYPNPFNPETALEYHLPRPAEVVLTIYDLHGQRVRQLVHGTQSAGIQTVQWNGRDEAGRLVASGIYFYRIEVKTKAVGEYSFMEVKKMILVK